MLNKVKQCVAGNPADDSSDQPKATKRISAFHEKSPVAGPGFFVLQLRT